MFGTILFRLGGQKPARCATHKVHERMFQLLKSPSSETHQSSAATFGAHAEEEPPIRRTRLFTRLGRALTLMSPSKKPALSSVRGSIPETLPTSVQNKRATPNAEIGMTVRLMLNHPTLGPKFRHYAKMHHADEGILFLDELFAVDLMETDRAVSSRFLYKYFVDSATHWINLPADVHDDLLQRFSSSEDITVCALFDLAVLEVICDLKRGNVYRDFCMKDAEAKEFVHNAPVYVLDNWLSDRRNFQASLIALAHERSTCNIIRFCVSVAEYEKLPKCDVVGRKTKANKIASAFVHNGSMFQVSSLDKLYVNAITKDAYEYVFADARIECLRELTKNHDVMDLTK